MRKTNKIISLILMLGILLTVALPATVSAAISFSDVPSDYTYYSAITNLTAEGIINGFEDGTFKPEEPVTRAQFTKIICYAQGAGEIKYSEADRAKFPDVDPNHWAIDNITTAKNSGIINGYDDGTFKPENSVLYEQAVKMAVCALGYTEDRAAREGGYPGGYLSIASKAGLLDKISGAKQGEPLTRGRVAQLIDNMLGAEMYDASEGTTTGGTMRDETSDKTSAEGRIVGIYGTSLYYGEESECNKKQIELELNNGDREFYGIADLDIPDLNEYLGRSVIVYYEEEAGADYYEAYNIAFQKKKNYEVNINLDDIEDYSATELEYYVEDEEDTEVIDIDSNIAIIHNGQVVGDDFDEIIDDSYDQSGYITLVCSQDNETADVAFIRTYETIVVNSKDSINYKIYDLNDTSRIFVLDETDRSKTITFTKDGASAKFSDIKQYDVVSISTSEDGKLIDVQISSKTQKGTVSDMLYDGSIKLSNGTTYYKFSDSCVRNEEISPGTYLTLYLDAFGKIGRYVLSAEKAYTYGYLAAAEGGTMTNPEVEVMVYKMSASNSTLTSKIYSLKDTVKIDGKNYSVSKDSDEILDLLRDTASKSGINAAIDGVEPTNTEFAQPIRFTTSQSDVIDSLLTTESTGEISVSMNIKYHTDDPILCKTDKTKLDKYSISSSVPVLLVPSDRANGTYMTKTYSYFEKDESYYVQLVNVNSSNQPQAIYVYGTATGGTDVTAAVLSEDDKPMIVTEVSKASYMDQNRICLRLLCVDGTEHVVYDDGRDGTEIISDIAVGDVIRVAADSEKKVNAIQLVAAAADIVSGDQEGFIKVEGTTDEYDMEAPYRVILGLVHNVTANTKTLVIAPSFDSSDRDEETHTYVDGVKVYLVDTKNERVPVAESNFGEIIGYNQQNSNASKVMIYTADGDVEAMIIFK